MRPAHFPRRAQAWAAAAARTAGMARGAALASPATGATRANPATQAGLTGRTGPAGLGAALLTAVLPALLPAGVAAGVAALGSTLPGTARAQADALATVTALYQQIGWQASVTSPAEVGTPLLARSEAELGRLFSPALARLLVDDRRCTQRRQQVCGLDFDPLWDSQDPLGMSASLAPGAKPDQVKVVLSPPSGQPRAPMVVQLLQVNGAWRVDDIRYPGQRPSLKALLQRGAKP